MLRKLSPRRAGFAWSVAALGLAVNFVPVTAQSQQVSKEEPAKSASSKEAIQNMPRLQEKGVMTVTGTEDWASLTGFGKDSTMAGMMTLMMVGGSGMEHMKMGSMKKAAMPGGKDKGVQPAGWKVTLNTKPETFKVGKNTLDFTILDPMGKPVTGAKVTSSVAMTSMDMGTTHPKAQAGKDGHYTTEAEFSMKGPWRVTFTVTPPNQKPFTQSFDFNVAQ